jgi:hypothetical protein
VTTRPAPSGSTRSAWIALCLLFLLLVLQESAALAHDISQADRAAVAQIEGPAPGAFLYLGAKHMVTGIDHILFLIGVIFFLYRLRDVVVYVTMFTIGHSLTLMGGVLLNTGANSYVVDAIIGFSVVYKAFENLGGFRKLGRPTRSFAPGAFYANLALMAAGFVLMAYQLTGYFAS